MIIFYLIKRVLTKTMKNQLDLGKIHLRSIRLNLSLERSHNFQKNLLLIEIVTPPLQVSLREIEKVLLWSLDLPRKLSLYFKVLEPCWILMCNENLSWETQDLVHLWVLNPRIKEIQENLRKNQKEVSSIPSTPLSR